ncbi:MAG: hypothetical protein AAFQ65_03565 [Myxococcota bacterium]
MRNLLIALAGLLAFGAIGFAIVAHAIYVGEGGVDSRVLWCAGFALLFVVPQTHLLIAQDIQRPGSGLSAKDFPIPGVRSFMQAAIDTAGPFGLSAPLALSGLTLVEFGWRRIRGKTRE